MNWFTLFFSIARKFLNWLGLIETFYQDSDIQNLYLPLWCDKE